MNDLALATPVLPLAPPLREPTSEGFSNEAVTEGEVRKQVQLATDLGTEDEGLGPEVATPALN